jgi:hypothetical protein
MNPDEPAFRSRTKSESAIFGFLPDQNVKMIGHVIDCYPFLALARDDAGYVFLKLIVMLWPD